MTTKNGTESPREAAQRIGVSFKTVYNWITEGLPVEWVGRRIRVRPQTLDRWLAAQRKARIS